MSRLLDSSNSIGAFLLPGMFFINYVYLTLCCNVVEMSNLSQELKLSVSYKYTYLWINRLASCFSCVTTVSMVRCILVRKQSKLIGLHWLSPTVSGWRKIQQASEVFNSCAWNFIQGCCVAVAGVRSHCRTWLYTLSVQHLWRTSHVSSPKWRPHASLATAGAAAQGVKGTFSQFVQWVKAVRSRQTDDDYPPSLSLLLLLPAIAIASTTAPLPTSQPASPALPPRHG